MSDVSAQQDQGEGYAFIVRARLDPAPYDEPPRLLIRIESLYSRSVGHFTEIEAALASLRRQLHDIAGGRPH